MGHSGFRHVVHSIHSHTVLLPECPMVTACLWVYDLYTIMVRKSFITLSVQYVQKHHTYAMLASHHKGFGLFETPRGFLVDFPIARVFSVMDSSN